MLNFEFGKIGAYLWVAKIAIGSSACVVSVADKLAICFAILEGTFKQTLVSLGIVGDLQRSRVVLSLSLMSFNKP